MKIVDYCYSWYLIFYHKIYRVYLKTWFTHFAVVVSFGLPFLILHHHQFLTAFLIFQSYTGSEILIWDTYIIPWFAAVHILAVFLLIFSTCQFWINCRYIDVACFLSCLRETTWCLYYLKIWLCENPEKVVKLYYHFTLCEKTMGLVGGDKWW